MSINSVLNGARLKAMFLAVTFTLLFPQMVIAEGNSFEQDDGNTFDYIVVGAG